VLLVNLLAALNLASVFFKRFENLKNVKNVKKRDQNEKRKKRFLHIWFGCYTASYATVRNKSGSSLSVFERDGACK